MNDKQKERILNVLKSNPKLSKSKISKLCKINYYQIEFLLKELLEEKKIKEKDGYYSYDILSHLIKWSGGKK